MSRKSVFYIYNQHAFGGDLPELLAEARDRGLSFDAIASWLHTDYDIDVSGRTVRRWYDQHVKAVQSCGR
jgi:hypothetical protein